MLGHGVVSTATALEHQRTIGIEGIEKFGHGAPLELKTPLTQQVTGQFDGLPARQEDTSAIRSASLDLA
jgi:hypothetical protein